MIITIDGAPATGKTTIAKMIAAEHDMVHLDSGAIFRTITLYCLNSDINLDNEREVIHQLHHVHITLKQDDVILNGINVSEAIRTPEVTNNVCRISHIPAVRSFVKNFQQTAGKKGNVVCDGRKVGTEVFPQAEKKFFLTANLRERASRRWLEYIKTNPTAKLSDVYNDLQKREETEKENGILRMPDGAIIIDTSGFSIEETLSVMDSYI